MSKKISELEKQLEEIKSKYSKFLEEKERIRKRQQDVHFTPKDREILIESFVIGGVIENLITKLLSKVL
jgi:molecular chaperone GrpE (heat shock protein)